MWLHKICNFQSLELGKIVSQTLNGSFSYNLIDNFGLVSVCYYSTNKRLSLHKTNIGKLRLLSNMKILWAVAVSNEMQKCTAINFIEKSNRKAFLSLLCSCSFLVFFLVFVAVGSIEKRWRKIKPHTALTKDLFVKAVMFIINNSYFKYNGEYYLQKFGLPMGNSTSEHCIRRPGRR